MIRTGVGASRIGVRFREVVDAVAAATVAVAPTSSMFLYGSVATGQAVPGRSDVDVLTIGLPADDARRIGGALTDRFAGVCRAVEIAAGMRDDFGGDHDEAYGNQVFLRHYCVHIVGPNDLVPDQDFPADVRAARGFNGDVGRHRDAWRAALASDEDPAVLARRLARKSLLAVGGLVSVHDGAWTTDRERAAGRWAEIEPRWEHGLDTMLGWVDEASAVSATDVGSMLDRVVDPLVERFSIDIGLWV